MKKHIELFLKSTVLLCCTAALGSCELESEDYNSVNDTVFPKTETDSDMLVTGSAYEVFRMAGWSGIFADDVSTSYIGACDIVISKAGQWHPFTWGNFRIDMYPLNQLWNATYTKLSLFKQVEDMLGYLPYTDAKIRARQIAEMKLAQGWLAFQLWTVYGNIPLIPVEALNNPLDDKEYPRATDEEMDEYIVSNLTEAIPDLDPIYSYGDPDYGRFTQALGHMILLRYYMQKRDWEKAEAEGRELMDPKYGLEIIPKYRDLFTLAGEGNKETIWSCVAERGIIDGTGVFVSNSLPFDYDCGVAACQKWNGNALTWPFYHSFEEGDQRITDGMVIAEYIGTSGEDHSYANDYQNGDSSHQLYWGPAAVKYEVDPNTTGYDSDIDWIVYRYADAITLLAEAIVKQDGPTQEALELMNRVRTRAGLEAYEMADVPDTETFMEKLLEERAHELWWENDFRRLDLLRNDLWDEKMKEKCNFYGETAYIGKKEYELYPIPTQAIVDSGNAIAQNPGY